jgi:hypothetical protein
LVTYCVETAFFDKLLKERKRRQEYEEEDAGSYWMTLRERILTSEGESSRSQYVESSFWKRLWTRRETDY